jgi:hypothetical protein
MGNHARRRLLASTAGRSDPALKGHTTLDRRLYVGQCGNYGEWLPLRLKAALEANQGRQKGLLGEGE